MWKDMDVLLFFFQAEDGIRDLVRSRGLGDVYKRQVCTTVAGETPRSRSGCSAKWARINMPSPALMAWGLSLIHI